MVESQIAQSLPSLSTQNPKRSGSEYEKEPNSGSSIRQAGTAVQRAQSEPDMQS
jgi:serine/threonine protein kinase